MALLGPLLAVLADPDVSFILFIIGIIGLVGEFHHPGTSRAWHRRTAVLAAPLLAPEHAAVVSTDPQTARAIGRKFVKDPYLNLRNYVNNLLRHGFADAEVADGGSDRLIDALVLYDTPENIRAGLAAHAARIPCPATGRSPASSTDAGHRGQARISRTWRALGETSS
jgi:hypothetical protein